MCSAVPLCLRTLPKIPAARRSFCLNAAKRPGILGGTLPFCRGQLGSALPHNPNRRQALSRFRPALSLLQENGYSSSVIALIMNSVLYAKAGCQVPRSCRKHRAIFLAARLWYNDRKAAIIRLIVCACDFRPAAKRTCADYLISAALLWYNSRKASMIRLILMRVRTSSSGRAHARL